MNHLSTTSLLLEKSIICNLFLSFFQTCEGNVYTLTPSPELSLSSENAICFPFNKIMYSIGNKLTFDSTNNCIVVGTGVNHIKVSGAIMQKCTDPDLCGGYITKNGFDSNAGVTMAFTYLPVTNQMFYIGIADKIISVSEGDKIYLVDYVNRGGINVTLISYNGRSTYLTVEVID